MLLKLVVRLCFFFVAADGACDLPLAAACRILGDPVTNPSKADDVFLLGNNGAGGGAFEGDTGADIGADAADSTGSPPTWWLKSKFFLVVLNFHH